MNWEWKFDFVNNDRVLQALSLFDFTSGEVPIDLVFSRNSIATAEDASGDIKTFSVNQARLTDKGLFVGANYNELCPRTICDMQAGWGQTGATSAQLDLNELNYFRGVRVHTQGGVWNRIIIDTLSALDNAENYYFKVYYQAGTSGQARIVLRSASGNETRITGNVGNLSVSASDGGTISNLSNVDLGNDNYVVRGVFSPNDNDIYQLGIGPNSSTVDETIIALGFSLIDENNNHSIIETEGSEVTKQEDNAVYNFIYGEYTDFITVAYSFYTEGSLIPRLSGIFKGLLDEDNKIDLTFNSNDRLNSLFNILGREIVIALISVEIPDQYLEEYDPEPPRISVADDFDLVNNKFSNNAPENGAIFVLPSGLIGLDWHWVTGDESTPNFPHLVFGFSPNFIHRNTTSALPAVLSGLSTIASRIEAQTIVEQDGDNWNQALEMWIADNVDGLRNANTHEVMVQFNRKTPHSSFIETNALVSQGVSYDYVSRNDTQGGTWVFHRFQPTNEADRDWQLLIDPKDFFDYIIANAGSMAKPLTTSHYLCALMVGNENWLGSKGKTVIKHVSHTLNSNTYSFGPQG